VCAAIPLNPEPEQEIEGSPDAPPEGKDDETQNDFREVSV
jgi:hypothetical protein